MSGSAESGNVGQYPTLRATCQLVFLLEESEVLLEIQQLKNV